MDKSTKPPGKFRCNIGLDNKQNHQYNEYMKRGNMWNPFAEKVVIKNVHGVGLKRWFKLVTADGRDYYTTRTDYIRFGWIWDKRYYAEKVKIRAIDLVNKEIWVDGCTQAVLPIMVKQYREEVVPLINTWSQTYYFDKPTLELPKGELYEFPVA